ncbi:hypothetical protein LCM23_12845 [Cytobacillus kochii]|uniref:hypothetical protein n=1 Tax=Cytobacillus kochii TaxID=859143 RepID=UPI001CD6A747|nr:hypothetical protein [Cytobacillus kochii]MCA1026981.1 hypothetical protein [Cytobacillus kochii]
MGDNEVKLVEGYLRLEQELTEANNNNDNYNAKIIKSKMEGIVFSYETYTSHHWSTFEHLLERYARYNK